VPSRPALVKHPRIVTAGCSSNFRLMGIKANLRILLGYSNDQPLTPADSMIAWVTRRWKIR
jgi:hypothetical protein